MAHDRDYFRRRAEEARAAAFCRDEGLDAEVAGQLALAYGALARRRGPEAPDQPPLVPDKIEA